MLYGTAPPIEAGANGVYKLFDGDLVTVGATSRAIKAPPADNRPGYNKTAYANFLTAPTAAIVALQFSSDDVDAHYITGDSATFATPAVSGLVSSDIGNSRYYRFIVISGTALTALTATIEF